MPDLKLVGFPRITGVPRPLDFYVGAGNIKFNPLSYLPRLLATSIFKDVSAIICNPLLFQIRKTEAQSDIVV